MSEASAGIDLKMGHYVEDYASLSLRLTRL
jgi:hypothetical protein